MAWPFEGSISKTVLTKADLDAKPFEMMGFTRLNKFDNDLDSVTRFFKQWSLL
jgi:hypothetical protein